MEMEIVFPGGMKVDAEFRGHTIRTDQSVLGGGDGSAPAPFDLFLASLGTCAGVYILAFCRERNLPMENIRVIQRFQRDPNDRMIKKISIEVRLPPDFPEKYKNAIIKSAELCAVKRHLEEPPEFEVYTSSESDIDSEDYLVSVDEGK